MGRQPLFKTYEEKRLAERLAQSAVKSARVKKNEFLEPNTFRNRYRIKGFHGGEPQVAEYREAEDKYNQALGEYHVVSQRGVKHRSRDDDFVEV
jgi:hypothetical protein